MHGISLLLRDFSASLVAAWEREFAGDPAVRVVRGDIFSDRSGPVDAAEPIDVLADAVVSPANSFGFMDGGIDAVFTYALGPGVQRAVRAAIEREHGGELPVGMALIVPTHRAELPWCISAPTMRVPEDVSGTCNAYLAFRAALRAVLRHNRELGAGQRAIERVLCPGLGTGVGQLPPERCARQMRAAWVRVVHGESFVPESIFEAIADERELRS